MKALRLWLPLGLAVAGLVGGCGDDDRPTRDGGGGGTDGGGGGMDARTPRDVQIPDVPFTGDAACATATSAAEVGRLPVDILWMVDNSTSMAPAIDNVQRGLNAFANRIADSGLDYRVIMLSLQGRSADRRLPVCIPPPLAGDGDCGDGDRFFHVSIDVRSTQPVEQFLGSLGQTTGYAAGAERGSAPWRHLLREDSTKTLVFVTDDNARTCARPGPSPCRDGDPPIDELALESFPGGGNPFNSNELGPGILTSEYGTLFEGYTFNAIYGWGSEADPDVLCTYPGGGEPPNPGWTYTTLVGRTGGVRAQICQQSDSAAWDRFFGAVASTVESTSRLSCTIDIPPPPDGMTFNADKVNVLLQSDGTTRPFVSVGRDGSCADVPGGWRYDNPAMPTQVQLCPEACEQAQAALEAAGEAQVLVQFGCDTLLI